MPTLSAAIAPAAPPAADTPRQLRQLLQQALRDLSACPEHEAERWICRRTGWSRARLYTELDTQQPILLDSNEWQRRMQGEPLAYIWGEEEFFGLRLSVSPDVLIPRPDTELLVERALDLLDRRPADRPLNILDLGTGSGAIALALQHSLPEARVTATDQSARALDVARKNARDLQLAPRFVQTDWLQGITPGPYWNLIVSNPPYVDPQDPHLDALTHEPQSALTATDHGLADLQTIIGGAPAHLDTDGILIVEHGHDQGAAVRAMFSRAGFERVITTRDYGGNERTTEGRLP